MRVTPRWPGRRLPSRIVRSHKRAPLNPSAYSSRAIVLVTFTAVSYIIGMRNCHRHRRPTSLAYSSQPWRFPQVSRLQRRSAAAVFMEGSATEHWLCSPSTRLFSFSHLAFMTGADRDIAKTSTLACSFLETRHPQPSADFQQQPLSSFPHCCCSRRLLRRPPVLVFEWTFG